MPAPSGVSHHFYLFDADKMMASKKGKTFFGCAKPEEVKKAMLGNQSIGTVCGVNKATVWGVHPKQRQSRASADSDFVKKSLASNVPVLCAARAFIPRATAPYSRPAAAVHQASAARQGGRPPRDNDDNDYNYRGWTRVLAGEYPDLVLGMKGDGKLAKRMFRLGSQKSAPPGRAAHTVPGSRWGAGRKPAPVVDPANLSQEAKEALSISQQRGAADIDADVQLQEKKKAKDSRRRAVMKVNKAKKAKKAKKATGSKKSMKRSVKQPKRKVLKPKKAKAAAAKK
eukprot:gene8547-1598_t